MSRWFRHYAGMMRDDKLVSVAMKSKQPVHLVVWVWGAILESAAEIDDGGRFDVDPDEVAYFLRADATDISTILHCLENAGRVAGSCVVKWGDRQFQSDRSAERQKRYRERRREVTDDNGDGEITSRKRHGDAPETETETDISEPKGSSARAVAFQEKIDAVGSCLKAAWPCPDGVDPNHWRDFKRNRKTRRLTNSETAYEGQLKAIAEIADAEWPPGRLVQYAAEKGWGTINDPRKSRFGNERPDANPTGTALARVQSALRSGGGFN